MAFLVNVLFFLFSLLPQFLVILLGRFLGFLLHRVVRLKHDTVRENLEFCFPDCSVAERERIMTGFYRNLGLVVVETLQIPRMSAEKVQQKCKIFHPEHYLDAAKLGKGVLILTAHVGNWEIGLARAGQFGKRVSAVVKEVKREPGKTMVAMLRANQGILPIPRRNSMRQIVKELKMGGAVGFVLDQNMIAREGVFVDFFGKPACTIGALAVLAKKYGVPVVPVQFYRGEDLKSHYANILPPIEWEEPHENTQDNVVHNTQRYTKCIENMIRQHPEQWIWNHKRWRTQPAKEPAPAEES